MQMMQEVQMNTGAALTTHAGVWEWVELCIDLLDCRGAGGIVGRSELMIE